MKPNTDTFVPETEDDFFKTWDRADELLAKAIALYKQANVNDAPTRCRSLSLVLTHAETALLWSNYGEEEEDEEDEDDAQSDG